MHLVPQTLRYKIWLCSSLTKLKTSSIEYVLMILVGSYTQCVTGVLPPQKQLQSESLAKQFNTLSYIQLYQNARILEMIPAESQKIPTESPYPKVPIALILGTFSFFIPQPLSYSEILKKTYFPHFWTVGRVFFIRFSMATIKLAALKHTKAKNGSYKIRVSIGHRSETRYIVTPYSVNALSEFDNGVATRLPNAHDMNIKLRNLLNDYEERLERVPSPDDYTCKELRDLLKSMRPHSATATFRQVSERYQKELSEDGRGSYAGMLKNSLRLFAEFANGDIYLSEINAITISNFERWLKRRGAPHRPADAQAEHSQ